jgi:hypothetical protein
MENNKFESLQSIKLKQVEGKIEEILKSKTGKFIGFSVGNSNQITEITAASQEEIISFIVDRVAQGTPITHFFDGEESKNLIRDNELINTADHSNAGSPGVLFLGLDKIATFESSQYDPPSKSEFFNQIQFSGTEDDAVMKKVKDQVESFEHTLAAPVDSDLSSLVMAKLKENLKISGYTPSQRLLESLIRAKIFTLETLSVEGIVNEQTRRLIESNLRA